MNHNTFPFPEPEPLTRLNTRDDLKINAERWNLAHDYHRQRQNIIHQSLWQPGIVYGLGVKVIDPPETTSSQFRDNRWIEIQPGIAIDIEGNPIVVSPKDDRTLRIAIPAPSKGSVSVSVVIRYVDPSNLDISHTRDRIIERFRLDQIKRELEPSEIELCRIQIERNSTPNKDIELKLPQNPLSPNNNELDLRYRQVIQVRAQSTVEVGTLKGGNNVIHQGLLNLSDSFSVLYPRLNCIVKSINIDEKLLESTDTTQLIYLSSRDLLQWAESNPKKINFLSQYLKLNKGKILIELQGKDSQEKDFREIISTLTDDAVVEQMKITTRNSLMRHPFLFGLPPSILGVETKILRAGNIMLIAGYLSKAWYGEKLRRNEIREAQEFGINLIYFCWQQMYIYRLLQ